VARGLKAIRCEPATPSGEGPGATFGGRIAAEQWTPKVALIARQDTRCQGRATGRKVEKDLHALQRDDFGVPEAGDGTRAAAYSICIRRLTRIAAHIRSGVAGISTWRIR
jgi:hypothetical protein